jgi:hypothetical protein
LNEIIIRQKCGQRIKTLWYKEHINLYVKLVY